MTTPIEHVSVYFEWIHLDDLTNMNASRDELKGQKVPTGFHHTPLASCQASGVNPGWLFRITNARL